MKTELLWKCSCKLRCTNVASGSRASPCSDRLLSFQTAQIGPPWPLPELPCQRKQPRLPEHCVCGEVYELFLQLGFASKKTIRFSLGSVRTPVKGMHANTHVNATKPVPRPHGAGVAVSLSENFSHFSVSVMSGVLKVCINTKNKPTNLESKSIR